MAAPRLRLAAACSAVACNDTPHCSEKLLLELQPRELGVIRTYAKPISAAIRRFNAWLRTFPSIASSANAFLYVRRYRVNPMCTQTCRRSCRILEAGKYKMGRSPWIE